MSPAVTDINNLYYEYNNNRITLGELVDGIQAVIDKAVIDKLEKTL